MIIFFSSGLDVVQKIFIKNQLPTVLAAALILIAAACGSDIPAAVPPVTPTVIVEASVSEATQFAPTAVQAPAATPAPSAVTILPETRPASPVPTREPTESFVIQEMELEPVISTVFEILLSKLPDNKATREYTRLGNVAGFIDALGFDPLRPGIPREEQRQYFEDLVTSDLNGTFVPLWEWPAEMRDYQSRINTYPDLAFNWISVDQFAHSDNFTFRRNSQPLSYDVAIGAFDPVATTAFLARCDCDQPEIREHDGIEYFAWGDGDGRGFIQDRLKRPFYDHIGRGPHLLVRDGEAYYSIRDGVIDEHIDVIQGTSPSLAESDDYVSAVQWIASMGIVSEITLRSQDFTVEGVAVGLYGQVTAREVVQGNPLLLPFTLAATGIGYDGERSFAALVIVHENTTEVEANLEILLTRLRNVTPSRRVSSSGQSWAYLIDQVGFQVSGRFLISRIFFTQPQDARLMGMPNSLLVHE